jgi:hypothetical protein
MSNTKALVHFVADCKVCGKHWEDYMTGQNLASEHAKKTGHRVMADLGYVVEYGGGGKRAKPAGGRSR